MDELLALLGQHWRLLALYPGGLTMLAAVAAATVLGGVRIERRLDGVEVAVAAVWLMLGALLPLPGAGWPYDIDLVAVLLALELPYMLLLLRSGSPSAADRTVALLSIYPLLMLAAAALGQQAGSWVLHEINRSMGALHWAGLAAWSAVLPPLLGLGPWRTSPLDVLDILRRTIHMFVLLAAAIPANDGSWRLGTLAGYAVLLLLLALLDRRWRADPWRLLRWQPWLCLLMLALLAAFSLQRYFERIW